MELVVFKEPYRNLIDEYQLVESQLQFTGHPQHCLKLVSASRTPILGIVDGNLVTYFDLHKEEGVEPYSDNQNAILVRAFSTDFRKQGKGYAKQALKLLPAFVKKNFPQVDEIVLAVNVKNVAAQELYKKCGFIDHGERRQGTKGELIVMSYSLNTSDTVGDVKQALKAYIDATNTHQFQQVQKLLHEKAAYIFSDQSCKSMVDIQAYFERAWKLIEQEVYSISNVEWLFIHETSATCIYTYHYEGYHQGQFVQGSGRATNVFVVEHNEWKLIHEHLSTQVQ